MTALWRDDVVLRQLVRQKEKSFVELLCRIRTATHTRQDVELLQSRVTPDISVNSIAVRLFVTNAKCDDFNNLRLASLVTVDNTVHQFRAVDTILLFGAVSHASLIPSSANSTCDILGELNVCKGFALCCSLISMSRTSWSMAVLEL